ncbi:Ubiquitin carboxyl-terminal hydrolase 12 [Komagataella phaffii CBS 7435]|uniref:ubiquitinyl hydrolase 1 n=1 Tax=Komagataella phaffii (strain ATCC 76273 / CBS 7435 / CECT 11047 / NRRL Y-11430 / Wegner 21-1) TaxID=981350 RepID=F2QVY0_KOMPC|nr:GQ67_03681T0 [Komagataella phaffii]AOA69011.1 GQ68_03653T0 [Komagataella phaffii GS115]CAH2449579.1 Ubiquitin carboxyl-terminal hydrolase 12 [Komagataella phaffii CBS 7435]CCA39558.1 Ubiquitin carboxyl-terminal hydrolase 12 [Komagataella phaffii CBS 7435]
MSTGVSQERNIDETDSDLNSGAQKSQYESIILQRQVVQKMLDTYTMKEGDVFCLVPKDWYQRFFTFTYDPTDNEIFLKIGIINIAELLDANGLVKKPDGEDFVEYEILPYTVFQQLVSWYGLFSGLQPIQRIVIARKDGELELEVYPCYFRLHLMDNERNSLDINNFILSRYSTIRDLKYHATERFNTEFYHSRLWLVDDPNISNLPLTITVSSFEKIKFKKLLVEKIEDFDKTLEEAGLNSCHLVVEYKLKKDSEWPSDITCKPAKLSTGLVGLTNLGNTCYMNSALQCLMHIPELSNYFLYDFYKEEINVDNPLGNGGRLAIAFGSLIHTTLGPKKQIVTYATPKDFKLTLGRFNSMFLGYHQQDSQELLAFLLDGLHEDLNRILKKPYLDKPELKDHLVQDKEAVRQLAEDCWSQHKMRNDSIITDLFVGLYKSTLVCPVCQKISITFDPFNDLTLPLPVDKKWYHQIIFFPETGYPKALDVELDKSSTFDHLKNYVSSKLQVPINDLIGADIFNSQFYKNFEANDPDLNYLPISDLISSGDKTVFYQVKHKPGDLVVPVFNTLSDDGGRYAKPFGLPFLITISEDESFSFGSIRDKLERKYDQLSTLNYFDQIKQESKEIHKLADFPTLNKKYQNDSPNEDNSLSDVDCTSDISFANPKISGDFAFNIKLFDSSREFKPRYNLGARHIDIDENEDDSLWLPQTNNSFGNLPILLDKLCEKKRAFYTYKKFEAEEELADEDDSESVNVNVEEVDENDNNLDTQQDESNDESMMGGMFEESKNSAPVSPPCSEVATNTESNAFEPLIKTRQALVCEWEQDSFGKFFVGLGDDDDKSGTQTWETPEVIPNEELIQNKKLIEEKLNKNIALQECLDIFSKPELLGENDLWYCPNCKDHRQATKTIEIWKTPDILTIHLKRFENQRSFSDKIDAVVDFPIEALDMSEYVVNPETGDEIYDLFAVDNHFGGLGGGHYTSYVKNHIDHKWYYFDDARVSAAEPEQAIKGSAYLLFYRRRSSTPLGGEYLRQMMTQVREQEEVHREMENEILRDYVKLKEMQDAITAYEEKCQQVQVSEAVESTLDEQQLECDSDRELENAGNVEADAESSQSINQVEKDQNEPSSMVSSANGAKRRKKQQNNLLMSRRKQYLDSKDLQNSPVLEYADDSILGSPISDDDRCSSYSSSVGVPNNNNDSSCGSPENQ